MLKKKLYQLQSRYLNRKLVFLADFFLSMASSGLVLLLALLFAFIKIDAATSHQHLSHGYVTEKYIDDGHYWYSSWTFGNYTISKRHGGSASYCVTIEDGDIIYVPSTNGVVWGEDVVPVLGSAPGL